MKLIDIFKYGILLGLAVLPININTNRVDAAELFMMDEIGGLVDKSYDVDHNLVATLSCTGLSLIQTSDLPPNNRGVAGTFEITWGETTSGAYLETVQENGIDKQVQNVIADYGIAYIIDEQGDTFIRGHFTSNSFDNSVIKVTVTFNVKRADGSTLTPQAFAIYFEVLI